MTDDPSTLRRSVVSSALVVEGGLVLVALVLGWLFGLAPLERIDWTLPGWGLGLAAALPMVAALVLVTYWPIGPFAKLDDVVRRTIVPLFRSCTLLDLALISALAGLGEELLFRGVVQLGIERASGSAWLGLAAASLLFGLAHPITPFYAVLAAVIGVYFGWLLVASENLLVPVVAHGAYDFVALLYLVRGSPMPESAGQVTADPDDEWSI